MKAGRVSNEAHHRPAKLESTRVAIGIFKHRHEVLIAILAKQRRRRLTIQNTREDFDRLTAILSDYGLPVRIGFEVSN